MDRWKTLTVVCKGGLDLASDALSQGTTGTGTAKILQNYEPSIEGGYEKILGYTKYSTTEVTGTGPILGVKVALGGVYAAREDEVYFGTGTTWTALTTGARTGDKTKVRFIRYSISAPVVVFCDGVNPAGKHDGTTYTLLNGTDSPANPKYAMMFLSRLVLAGYSADPYSIIISAPNDDEDFTAASGAAEINVGDLIVGLRTFRGTPYIFCQNSIYKIEGSSLSDFKVTPVTRSIGCVSGDTIQEIAGDLLFLAPDGLRSLAATARIGDVDLSLKSQKIQPIIKSFIGVFNSNEFSSCVIRKKGQYRLFTYDSALSVDKTAKGILGRASDVDAYGNTSFEWSTLAGIHAYCSDSEFDNDDETAVIGHPTTGFVYQMELGNDFAGTTIEYIYKSPDLTFNDQTLQQATLRKVLHRITVYTEVGGTMENDLYVKYDRDNNGIMQPSLISITQDGTIGVYDDAIYDTDTYDTVSVPVFRRNLIGSGFTASFQFSGTDSNPPHRIDSYQIEYALKGRR